jgi:hypothetical protein
MFVPVFATGIVERYNPTKLVVVTRKIGALASIAPRTRPGQITQAGLSAMLRGKDMVDLEGECVSRLRKPAVFAPAFRTSANAPFDINGDGHGPLLSMVGVFQSLASLGMQDSQQIRDVEIIIELFQSSVVKPALTSLCRKSSDPCPLFCVEADRQQLLGGRRRKTSGLNRHELVKNCGPDRY